MHTPTSNRTRSLIRFIALVTTALAIAGACSTPAHPVDATPEPTASSTPLASVAAGGGAVPVSASKPTAEAAAAMTSCQVGESIPLTMVAGMGLIPTSRDLPRYVPLTGREPEIARGLPVWVIQLKGDLPMPLNGEVWKDPTCIVIGGESGYYATGPVTNVSTGEVSTPEPPAVPPDLRLPALAP